jgi:hypothetical protein
MTLSEIFGKPTIIVLENLLIYDIFRCFSFFGHHELFEHILSEAMRFTSKDKLSCNEPVLSDEYFLAQISSKKTRCFS